MRCFTLRNCEWAVHYERKWTLRELRKRFPVLNKIKWKNWFHFLVHIIVTVYLTKQLHVQTDIQRTGNLKL
jgi:hypothetical protein